MKYIQADNLVKEYGSGETAFMAVRGMSFDIEQGEFAAIMGESGSGKSTLLTMMGALNSPTGGSYRVDDIDVYALGQDQRAEFRREFLGFIFQSFYLIPYLTVIENVMLPLATAPLGSGEKRSMAQRALELVRMGGKTHRLPGEISGGEQERLAIARAIVNEPTILLADEPTGNLDSNNSHAVMNLFQTLNEAGMTIVMVTHSQDCAQYAQRLLRVSDGLLEDGEEAEQKTNNLSDEVAWQQTGKVATLAS
jgi:putative ABC transport system ATP-binding protein